MSKTKAPSSSAAVDTAKHLGLPDHANVSVFRTASGDLIHTVKEASKSDVVFTVPAIELEGHEDPKQVVAKHYERAVGKKK